MRKKRARVAVAAVDPLSRSALRRVAVSLICAKIVLVPLAFDPRALVVFSLPKALLSHALGYLIAATLLALVLRYGWAVLRFTPVHIGVAGVGLAFGAATVLALDPIAALHGAHDRHLGLLTLIDNVVLFVAATSLIRSRGDLVAVVTALFAPVPAVLGYEAVQRLGWDPLDWTGGSEVRPFSTFGNAGILAQYLGTLAAAAGGIAASAPVSPRTRLLFVTLTVLLVVGALITATRAVLLGLAIGAALIAVAAFFRATSRRHRAALAATAASTFVALSLVTLGATDVGRRVQNLVELSGDATSDVSDVRALPARVALVRVAVAQVRDRPLFGVGPDNFGAAFPRYRPADAYPSLRSIVPETSPHSWVAHVSTSAGLVGLLGLLMTFAVALTYAARSDRGWLRVAAAAALASYLATGLLTVNDAGTEWLMWLALAGLAVPRHRTASDVGTPKRRLSDGKGPIVSWVGYILIVAALVLGIAGREVLAASEAAQSSRQARARGDRERALPAAQAAVALDGKRAEHWHGLGLSLVQLGRFAEAVGAFDQAVSLAPYHATYLGNLARAHLTLAAQGNQSARGAAASVARRAVETDPNNPDAHFTLALVSVNLGDHRAAADASERGMALARSWGTASVFETALRAYLAMGSPHEAERWGRLGVEQITPPPASVAVRVLLARALVAQGRIPDALAAVDAALSLDPQNQAALRLRSELVDAAR